MAEMTEQGSIGPRRKKGDLEQGATPPIASSWGALYEYDARTRAALDQVTRNSGLNFETISFAYGYGSDSWSNMIRQAVLCCIVIADQNRKLIAQETQLATAREEIAKLKTLCAK